MYAWLVRWLHRTEFARCAASEKITQDHLDLVHCFEQGDLPTAQRILAEHTERSKETMRAGIEQAGGT